MNHNKTGLNETNLHAYQNSCIDHIIDNPYCALFLDMGLGKTITTLTAIKKLMFDELEVSKVLIIAPKRVAENVWTSELDKWDHINHFKASRVIGTVKQRIEALKTEADLYLIGRDNIAWLVGLYGGGMLPFDMLIIDESSSFKNHKSNRFKSLKQVRTSFNRIVLLTGTPSPNTLQDLWAQIYLLDGGSRLGKFITHFRRDYFRPGKRNGAIIYNYITQDNGEQRVYDKIEDICLSMKAKDYLDLPERITNYIDIKFPPKIQKLYNDFEEEQVLELFSGKDETDISAVNAAALSNKLLQFSNGAVYDAEKNYHVVHDLKIDAIKEIIEDANGKPVLIAWTFRHDLYRLQEALKKHNPVQLKTEQDIFDWNSGKINILLMHPASGGHGLNLQAGGNIIVWFGQTWSLELYQQLNARLDRQGQDKPVIVHHLVASNTIETKVVNALARKEKGQNELMEAVKAKIAQYLKK
tara:strand:+ start:37927 stop:39333 length:1407 start_codon:yes stop_codon:yes gene_type:complete